MQSSTILICLVLCIFYYKTPVINGARILSIFAFPGPSHYIFGSGVLKGLAERGHEITSINMIPRRNPDTSIREILISKDLGQSKGI